jgi:hypothetical protein
VVSRRPDDTTVAWLGAHREALQLGGIVVGIAVLLVVDLSWFGLLLLALVIGAFELAVARIAELPAGGPEPEQRGAVDAP